MKSILLKKYLIVLGFIGISVSSAVGTAQVYNYDNSLKQMLNCLYIYQSRLSPTWSMSREGVKIISVGDPTSYRVMDLRALDTNVWKFYTDNYEAVSADLKSQGVEKNQTVSIDFGHTKGILKLDGSFFQLTNSDSSRLNTHWEKHKRLQVIPISFDLNIEEIEETYVSRSSHMADSYKRSNPEVLNPTTQNSNALRERAFLKGFTEQCSKVGKLKPAMVKIIADFKL